MNTYVNHPICMSFSLLEKLNCYFVKLLYEYIFCLIESHRELDCIIFIPKPKNGSFIFQKYLSIYFILKK